jgi:hypothetical protein
MKSRMAVMMTGLVLAMSATTLPASAKQLHISTIDELGGEQQTQLLSARGSQQQQKWSIDERDAKVSRSLTPCDRVIFDRFKTGIEQGLSPQQAAKKVGATVAKNTNDWYEGRRYGQDVIYLNLSKTGFATLRIDRQAKVVKVLQLGSRPSRET